MNTHRTPLHDQLVQLIRMAMVERGVGWMKLANLSGKNKATLACCIGKRRKKGFSPWRLIEILYSLGYIVELNVQERELTNGEREYFTARGRGKAFTKDKAAVPPTTIPVRSVVSHSSTTRRERTSIQAATAHHARLYRAALEASAGMANRTTRTGTAT